MQRIERTWSRKLEEPEEEEEAEEPTEGNLDAVGGKFESSEHPSDDDEDDDEQELFIKQFLKNIQE